MKKLSILIFILFSQPLLAQWSFRPQAGLGFTDNANYEDTGKDSDFFDWLRLSSTLSQPRSHTNIWLNAKDFFKENQNDVFSYRLSHTLERKSRWLGPYEWDLALGGMQYFNSSPATTEESFNSIYAETSVTKTWQASPDFEYSFEPGYMLRTYPNLSGRTDHSLSFALAADWKMASEHTLSPVAEMAFVFSNQSLYTKNTFELGLDWTMRPSPEWKFIVHFLSKYSTFPNRTISESTVVSNRRGQSRIVTQNEIETQSLTQIQGAVARMWEDLELQASLGLNSQSTRSGIEDYNELQGWVSITRPF